MSKMLMNLCSIRDSGWMQETTNHLPWETRASQNLDLVNRTGTQNKPLKVVITGSYAPKYFLTSVVSLLKLLP